MMKGDDKDETFEFEEEDEEDEEVSWEREKRIQGCLFWVLHAGACVLVH